jgi:GDPmannose 4,6-dehydratase
MLQQHSPDDYVIATGETHSVREFAQYAFECVALDYRDFVTIDKRLYRESETVPLCGDSSKAQSKLQWKRTKGLNDIINEMVENDLQLLQKRDEKYSMLS